MIGKLLLRVFGIEDEPAPPVPAYICPTCGHRYEMAERQDPIDAYLNGASVEWLEGAIEWKFGHMA